MGLADRPIFFLSCMWGMIGSDGIYHIKVAPEGLLILLTTQGRVHFPKVSQAKLIVFSQEEVQWRDFTGDAHAFLFGFLNKFKFSLRSCMSKMEPSVCPLSDGEGTTQGDLSADRRTCLIMIL